jgi:cytochrome bd-type quinol oxidase subunit 1
VAPPHLHEGRIAGHWLAVEGLPKPILWALVPMAFSGWVATLAGWYTTEIGRQPWLVQGVMTTEMAVADVPAPMVMGTLATYLAIYAALLFAYVGVVVYLARKAARGDDAPAERHDALRQGRSRRHQPRGVTPCCPISPTPPTGCPGPSPRSWVCRS